MNFLRNSQRKTRMHEVNETMTSTRADGITGETVTDILHPYFGLLSFYSFFRFMMYTAVYARLGDGGGIEEMGIVIFQRST